MSGGRLDWKHKVAGMEDAAARDAMVGDAVGGVTFPWSKAETVGEVTWSTVEVGTSIGDGESNGSGARHFKGELRTGETSFPSSKGCAEGSAVGEGSRHKAK
mgnify:CR=1 FL=1